MWKNHPLFPCGKDVDTVGKVIKNSVQRKSIKNVENAGRKNLGFSLQNRTFPPYPQTLLQLPLPTNLFLFLPLRGGRQEKTSSLSPFLFLKFRRRKNKKREKNRQRKKTRKTPAAKKQKPRKSAARKSEEEKKKNSQVLFRKKIRSIFIYDRLI